ncbi:DNA helicase/exodeoxyribonuclease V beta subunit [Kushneria sinocarnis]|uniref:RecBCD enzyme subunit RecB n=1 Tax=Kushneria sinocarnis TaxID=595502 RepID=A0A420WV54_9GAMM|nr:exodeoxyribonuclease V subunit beta [Kushneria sinocarnis]RKR02422.1 DNA helicase/exodeoxyribonuclease V beta subunit [Kushneria sinocarnis]
MSEHLDIATLPLTGRRLIEASAGTGKTFTLAALYVRLILGHGGEGCAFPRPLMPPEILVVTFTEAATEELRERIRLRLRQARDALLGREAADAVLARLLDEVDPAVRAVQASRLDGAARTMDDAAIFTIHGFCQRMLKRHAFDSGTLFAAELTNDTERLFETLVEDYWRCHFYPLDPGQQALLLDYWASPAALGQALRTLLHGGRPQPLIWNGTPIEAPETLEAALAPLDQAHQTVAARAARVRELWQSCWEEVGMLLREAIEQGRLAANRFKSAELSERLARLAQWCERGEHALESGLLTSGQPWCGQQRLSAATKKNAETPEHAFFVALDELAEAQQALPEVQPYILAHARDAVAASMANEKRRRGLWDFDDLLNGLDSALAGPAGSRLAGRIRRELPVAMIDEFQDTDPVQYRIFSSIYPAGSGEDADETTLLMIGDPKQAIYGFRGADIHTYLEARREVTAHYTLATNFRSTQAMVGAVNRIFGQCTAPFLLDDIPFESVAAQGRSQRLVSESGEEPALTCWLMPDEASVGREAYARCMAEATRADIQRLLAGGHAGTTGFSDDEDGFEPLRPSDLAVLVRTGREAELVRAALAQGGIRSVYLSQKTSVFQSPEAFHLLQLLEAVAQPDSDRRLRAALATRLLSDSLDSVAQLKVDELAWEAMVERFGEYHRLWQRDGVLPMLRAVMRHFAIGERLIARDDGERALTDLLHLGELAQAASVHLDGEQALLRWLHQALAGRFEAGLDPESLVQRLESDETLVRVITIHKSKGLEYAVVYLPFTCDYREIDARVTHFRLHEEERGRATIMAPTALQRQQADHERLAEDLRLLYVAMTRARYACRLGIAPLYKGQRKKGTAETATTLARSALGSLLTGHTGDSPEVGQLRALLGGLCDGREVAFAAPPQPRPQPLSPPDTRSASGAARRFSGRIDRNWWIASYTALVSGAQLATGEMSDDTAFVDESPGVDLEVLTERNPVPLPPAQRLIDFPRGPRAGTFLHGLFERVDFDRLASLDDPASAHRRELAALIPARLARRGFEAYWADILLEWMARVLPAPLHPAVPGLSLARLDHWRIELEFWLPTRYADSHRLDDLVRRHEPLQVERPALAERELTGMLKGYIDLLFEFEGRYYLLDWKSNHLGDRPEHYDEPAMLAAVGEHRYDLQYVLYTLALHRLLRTRLADYDYERHCGGVFYAFLRGMNGEGDGRGVLHRRPSRTLIEMLDGWLDGESVEIEPAGHAVVSESDRQGEQP